MKRFLLTATCFYLASAAATAQDFDPADLRKSVGVFARDGAVQAVAYDYRVLFHERGFELTPYLGEAAPRSLPLGLRVVGYGRGGQEIPAADAEPVIDGETVYLDHGGMVQTCEVRPEGVEQSFVFEQLPAGTGDLVVRLRCDALMPAAPCPSGEGLQFCEPGVGGVTVGTVTGLDAEGRSAPGSLRVDGESLEYRLPADFVDSAVLPLVLDPLVGAAVQLNTGGLGADALDVAYDVSHDVYLVVFDRSTGFFDGDVLAQKVRGSGGLTGSLLAIEAGSLASSRWPKVASINNRDAFVVVFEEVAFASSYVNDVRGAAVAAGTATVGANTFIADGLRPDVGGELSSTHNDAVCVYTGNASGRWIRAIEIDVSQGLALTPSGPRTLHTESVGHAFSPRIAKSGGQSGRYLVVWEVWQLGFAQPLDIDGIVIDRDLNPLSPVGTIVSVAGRRYTNPDVDGDGERWVTVWNRKLTSGGLWSVQGQPTTWKPGMTNFLNGTAVWIKTDSARNALNPSVAWLGGTCLVGYSLEAVSGSRSEVFVKTLDVFDCVTCENEIPVANAPADMVVAVGSKFSGGSSSEEALIARSRTNLANQLYTQRFASEDGTVTSLGGGCGGSRAWGTCARVGNGSFELRLTGALASTAAWAVVGIDRLNYGCSGGCMLIPDPFDGFVLSTSTNVRGNSAYGVPVPSSTSLRGLSFIAQWLTMPSGSPSCAAMPYALSNAIRVRIQ